MKRETVFFSDGEGLWALRDGEVLPLASGRLEQYRRNLAYLLLPDGDILLSNGRHLLRRRPDGSQALLAEHPLITLLAG